MKCVTEWITLTAAVAVTMAVSGCASGPPFIAVDQVPQGQGQVYVYRTWQFQGSAAVLKIIQDGVQMDKTLPNASWQHLVVPPGRHTFGLKEYLNSMSCAGAQVDVGVGQTVFLGVDFTFVSTVGTQTYSVCKLSPREESQALKDITGLKRSD